MSLVAHSLRLAITTRFRRVSTIPPVVPDGPLDWLTAEDGRPLLTQNLNNLSLEQRAVFVLLTQSNEAIITENGAFINTLES